MLFRINFYLNICLKSNMCPSAAALFNIFFLIFILQPFQLLQQHGNQQVDACLCTNHATFDERLARTECGNLCYLFMSNDVILQIKKKLNNLKHFFCGTLKKVSNLHQVTFYTATHPPFNKSSIDFIFRININFK
jgi:hypothetical protein